MKNIEDLLKAYEADAKNPKGLGRFEALNMLTNRDVLEANRNKLTTLQSARLLHADEKLKVNGEQVIVECGGKIEYMKIRHHNPVQSAWWWYLEQIPVIQFS